MILESRSKRLVAVSSSLEVIARNIFLPISAADGRFHKLFYRLRMTKASERKALERCNPRDVSSLSQTKNVTVFTFCNRPLYCRCDSKINTSWIALLESLKPFVSHDISAEKRICFCFDGVWIESAV